MVEDFQLQHWALLDLLYEYLDDGFKLTAITDVPCHLYCRMTTTPPRKHATPVLERGVWIRDDIRFCFVAYEDNEQQEPGDTLTHTFLKPAWPVCETRYFYFWGTINGLPTPSESPIFTFHFPAPPPKPPPPLERIFMAEANNRTIVSNHATWPTARLGFALSVLNTHGSPYYSLFAAVQHTATMWLYRSFLTFPTNTMPITAKVVSAQLQLFVWDKLITSSVSVPNICVQDGFQSDPVVKEDWYAQTVLTWPDAERDIRDLVVGAYNNFDFNPLGLHSIHPGNITKFCVRGQQDVDNTYPPLGANQVNYYSDQKGAGYRPLLKVAYYPA